MNVEEQDKICMELFGKKVKDVKWAMITNYVHQQLIDGEELLRTGLYSWVAVWDGCVKQFQGMHPEDFKKYDIIHVNLSGQDIHIVGDIREVLGKDTKTKIIANNDYTVELWQGSFDYLSTLRREIQYADVLFGTEPYQVGLLEVLTKRKVHQITHPCFVKRLKTLTPKDSKDVISVVWHRYDGYSIPPSIAVNGLGYDTRLIGYDPNVDKRKFLTTCHYNTILQGTNYMDFCDHLLESKVVVDPFTLTSQSRTGWDCAALGVPLVGSDRNESVRHCFPFTMCDPHDIKEIRRLTKKLLEDEEFRKKVIDYAKEKVEIVSYESCKEKYLKALVEGSPKINI